MVVAIIMILMLVLGWWRAGVPVPRVCEAGGAEMVAP